MSEVRAGAMNEVKPEPKTYESDSDNAQQPQEPKERKLSDRMFGGDRALWIIMAALAIVSLLVVYSSTASLAYKSAGGDTSYFFINQLKFILLGFVVVWIVHKIDYQTYAKYARLAFILALVLMLLTFFIGVNLNDASRWLKIPGTNYTIQPSDFLKVTLIMVLAKALSKRQATIAKIPLMPIIPLFHSKFSEQRKKQNREIFFDTTIPLLMPIALACGAIFVSNISTAALTFLTCLIMLYIGRVRVRELWRLTWKVSLIGIAALLLMSAMGIGRGETGVNRLKKFVGIEQADSTKGGNLQVEHAKIAIATGGVIGKGPGLSTQRANLSHSYSDFAYAFITEEYGLVGAIVVLALYLWLFFRTVIIFQKCERAFPSLLVLGLGVMIVLQAIFNMLVSVNLFPVTGQPLPLISMGGSSILFTSLALGMILGVSRQMQEKTLGTAKEDGIK